MPGPLHGVRVVDVSEVISGPLAVMVLAEQGAAVIKIDELGLDAAERQRLRSTGAVI